MSLTRQPPALPGVVIRHGYCGCSINPRQSRGLSSIFGASQLPSSSSSSMLCSTTGTAIAVATTPPTIHGLYAHFFHECCGGPHWPRMTVACPGTNRKCDSARGGAVPAAHKRQFSIESEVTTWCTPPRRPATANTPSASVSVDAAVRPSRLNGDLRAANRLHGFIHYLADE